MRRALALAVLLALGVAPAAAATSGAPVEITAILLSLGVQAAYLLFPSFGSSSATRSNFVFPFFALSIPTIQNCSGVPARSS